MESPDVRPQRLWQIRIGTSPDHGAERKLNEAAAEGYVLGGCIRPIDPGTSGAMYSPLAGAFVHRCMIWLDPAELPSLFHCWQIHAGLAAHSKGQNEVADLTQLLAYENQQGFALRQAIPCDGFLKDPEKRDPGTSALFLLFERVGATTTPFILDALTMKDERPAEDESVQCPVLGCDTVVPRMSRTDDLDGMTDPSPHRCPRHRVLISPTTFEYEVPETSLLWRSESDMSLIRLIQNATGRERTWAGMGRELNEDSLTWNVFRYLDREKLLGQALEALMPSDGYSRGSGGLPERVVYWSVDCNAGEVWDELAKARATIGESSIQGTAPDLIVITKQRIFVVSAKLCSSPITPASDDVSRYDPYIREYAPELFKQGLSATAEVLGSEGTRHFVLGHALSKRLNRPFTSMLVTRGSESSLVQLVGGAVSLSYAGDFAHSTWNQIRKLIDEAQFAPPANLHLKLLRRYLDEKTAGYESGKPQRLLNPCSPTV